jgi:class 3 adenylate cyclase
VVVSDLSGSTALGERLDPESLAQVMARYYEAMRAVVLHHGGTVEAVGDAVHAVFGIPAAHEDDALRAVRAAAGMHAALDELNRGRPGTGGCAWRRTPGSTPARSWPATRTWAR